LINKIENNFVLSDAIIFVLKGVVIPMALLINFLLKIQTHELIRGFVFQLSVIFW